MMALRVFNSQAVHQPVLVKEQGPDPFQLTREDNLHAFLKLERRWVQGGRDQLTTHFLFLFASCGANACKEIQQSNNQELILDRKRRIIRKRKCRLE